MQISLFVAIGDSSCKTLLFLVAAIALKMSFPIYSEIMGVKLPSVVCLSCLLRLLCLSPISLDLSMLCLIFFLSWLFSSSVMIDLSFSIGLAFQFNFLLMSLALIIPFSCADSFVMSDLSFFNQSGFSNDD